MNAIICPVSSEKIDSNVSRLTVFINVVSLAAFLLTLNPVFGYIVAIDYFIRAFLSGKYSPLRFISLQTIKALRLTEKPINIAQKIFASRLGFLCILASVVLLHLQFILAAYIVGGMLLVLAIADSVFDLCVGCLIYNYIVYPFYSKKMK